MATKTNARTTALAGITSETFSVRDSKGITTNVFDRDGDASGINVSPVFDAKGLVTALRVAMRGFPVQTVPVQGVRTVEALRAIVQKAGLRCTGGANMERYATPALIAERLLPSALGGKPGAMGKPAGVRAAQGARKALDAVPAARRSKDGTLDSRQTKGATTNVNGTPDRRTKVGKAQPALSLPAEPSALEAIRAQS